MLDPSVKPLGLGWARFGLDINPFVFALKRVGDNVLLQRILKEDDAEIEA